MKVDFNECGGSPTVREGVNHLSSPPPSRSGYRHVEKAFKIAPSDARDLLDVDAFQLGELCGGLAHEGRFVAFAAMRQRRQIGAIGFDEQSFHRNRSEERRV